MQHCPSRKNPCNGRQLPSHLSLWSPRRGELRSKIRRAVERGGDHRAVLFFRPFFCGSEGRLDHFLFPSPRPLFASSHLRKRRPPHPMPIRIDHDRDYSRQRESSPILFILINFYLLVERLISRTAQQVKIWKIWIRISVHRPNIFLTHRSTTRRVLVAIFPKIQPKIPLEREKSFRDPSRSQTAKPKVGQ